MPTNSLLCHYNATHFCHTFRLNAALVTSLETALLVGMAVPPPPPGEDNPDLYIPDIVKQFITHFYTQVMEKVSVSICL